MTDWHVIENDYSEGPVQAAEVNRLRALGRRIQSWWRYHISRRIPRLVWIGDEIDVSITFRENQTGELSSGGLAEIETQLHRMGIGFDRGQGCGGRDWEWDWSLHGPVNVTFRGRARNPERRVRETGPELKVVSK